jgi:glucose-6-phosphate 1-dehydrogenase
LPTGLHGAAHQRAHCHCCAPAAAQDASIIVDKPFGTDLHSARGLDLALHAVFDESRIFRIDHFLGKESVDNILAFRFANGLFEPLWNRDHISYVQIDVPEALSIEGEPTSATPPAPTAT